MHILIKSEIVKSHFKQLYKHFVFVEDGDGGRKSPEKYIDVNGCIDMVCGDKECFRKRITI